MQQGHAMLHSYQHQQMQLHEQETNASAPPDCLLRPLPPAAQVPLTAWRLQAWFRGDSCSELLDYLLEAGLLHQGP